MDTNVEKVPLDAASPEVAARTCDGDDMSDAPEAHSQGNAAGILPGAGGMM